MNKEPKELQSILHKYDSAMQEYCSKIFPSFWKYIISNRRQYDDFLKRLFDFYLFSLYLVDAGLFKDKSANEYPLKILYTKGVISYYAIYNCLRSGCVSEASVLARSLFEAMVNLKLILQTNIAERLKLYSNYRFASKWLHSKTNPDNYSDTERKIIEDKYNKIKGDYHPKYPYHWAWKIYCKKRSNKNPNLKFICGKLGLTKEYNTIYSTLSIAVHTDPHIDNLCTLDGKITISPYYSNMIYHVGFLSLFYFKEIIDSIVQYYKFDGYEDIQVYINYFLLDLNENYYKKKVAANKR
jgi:hypothetical protein